MNEIVERAAKAIQTNPFPEHHDARIAIVICVLRAIREPTDGMIDAGAKAMVGSDQDALDCWPAMIDEALKP